MFLGKDFYEIQLGSYLKTTLDFDRLFIYFTINFTMLKLHLQVYRIFDFIVWVPLKGWLLNLKSLFEIKVG